jgi:hypothetical protein
MHCKPKAKVSLPFWHREFRLLSCFRHPPLP